MRRSTEMLLLLAESWIFDFLCGICTGHALRALFCFCVGPYKEIINVGGGDHDAP